MEWDFTISQVSLREVHYTLENFLRDLQGEVNTNFSMYTEEQRKALCYLFYQVMYCKFAGHTPEAIGEIFKIDSDFVAVILQNNQENLQMLGAIIMSIFLKNLEETHGFLSDEENIRLVNAELRQFHQSHNL